MPLKYAVFPECLPARHSRMPLSGTQHLATVAHMAVIPECLCRESRKVPDRRFPTEAFGNDDVLGEYTTEMWLCDLTPSIRPTIYLLQPVHFYIFLDLLLR